MKRKKANKTELTERRLFTRDILRKAVRLALPALLSSGLVWLMSFLNVAFISAFLDYHAFASYGVISAYTAFAAGMFAPLATATSFLLERAKKKGNPYQMQKVIFTGLLYALIVGATATLLASVLAGPFCKLLATPSIIFDETVLFLRVFSATFIPILLFSVSSMMLITTGDFIGPLLAEVSAVALHGSFGYIFVGLFGWGVRGITGSAMLAQSIGAYICVHLVIQQLRKTGATIKIQVDRNIAKELRSEEHPAVFTAAIAGSFGLFLQYFIDKLGVATIAAFALFLIYQDLCFLPINALKTPARRLSEQYGDDKDNRSLIMAINPVIIAGCIYAILLIPITKALVSPIFAIITNQEQVITLVERLIALTSSYYVFYALSTLLSASLEGLGKKKVTMTFNIVFIYVTRFLILLPSAIFVQGMESVAVAYPLSWAVSAAALGVYYYASYSNANFGKKYSL